MAGRDRLSVNRRVAVGQAVPILDRQDGRAQFEPLLLRAARP